LTKAGHVSEKVGPLMAEAGYVSRKSRLSIGVSSPYFSVSRHSFALGDVREVTDSSMPQRYMNGFFVR
jgi:hypothetical protein